MAKKLEANVKEQYKTMTSNDGFSKKQLEQLGHKLQPIKEDVGEIKHRLDNVEKRLDNVEKRYKRIKSCPTIQREIIKQNSII